jgi:succinoglycan biosynthesis transport protein ExoP
MSEKIQVLARRNLDRSPSLRDVAAVFFRHQELLAVSFLLVLTAGVVYAVLVPSYKAEMKVLVRRGRIDPAVTPTQTASPAFEHDEISEEELNSEVELLRDEDLLRKVVIETGLAVTTSWVSRLRGEDQETRVENAVQRLTERLEVQPVRKSRLITVAYRSSDPHLSAAVLRSLADAYLAKHVEIRRPSGQQTFFEQQMKQSQRTLEQSEAQRIAFTRGRGVVSAALERDLTLQKLSEAQAADLGVQASIAEDAERVRSLGSKLRDLPQQRVTQVRNADNPQLQEKLKSKLLELELRRTELLIKFQPSYRLVQELDQQIVQAKSAIEAEDLKPLRDELTEQNPEYEWASAERMKTQVEMQSLEERHSVARLQVARYQLAAQKLGENAVTQDDLERKLKAAEDKYLLYANKREEARIGDALDENGILNVAIAEPPRVPALPAWPLWTATLSSIVAASLFSTGLVFAADRFDPSFRTAEEVIQFLGTPVLASLPARIEPQHNAGEP